MNPSTATLTHYAGQLARHRTSLIQKARQEAEQHRPPSNALHIDQHEADVQSEADGFLSVEHQLFTSELTAASRSASELQEKVPDVEGRIQQLINDQSLQSEAVAELAGERAKLVSATEGRMRAEVDLRAFRTRHGIVDGASYPESHIWHLGIIIALAFGETILNAFFYENAQGLLGGFFVAAGVAIVNMVSALVLGMLFRFKNLPDPEKKLGGWAALVGFVMLTVYCNALFAAFRGAYQLLNDPTDPTQIRSAFRAAATEAGRVFAFGMDFGDLMSFILFGLGILLSGVAFYKGMTFDDRYPGHGKKDRLLKAAKRTEDDTREVVRQRLKEFLQGRRRQVQGIVQEPMQLMNLAGARAAGLQQAQIDYVAHQDAIQRDLDLMIKTYREANVAIRATAAPAYFAEFPRIGQPPDATLVNGVLTRLNAIHERGKSLRDRYQEALSAKLNELQRDSAEILDRTFEEFLRRVERDAEAAINRATATMQRASDQTAVNAY